MQRSYNPVDYTFRWTEDWYKWNYKEAHKQARKARAEAAKDLRAQGHSVRVFTLKDQRISRGGMGTGRPHIDLVVNVYYLEVS